MQMMAILRAAAEPLTANQLAAQVGVHHTVVRSHLALLVKAGLVRGERLPIVGRGRPCTGYIAIETAPAEGYQTLAALLAEAVSSGDSVRVVGRRAGATVVPLPGGALPTLEREAERFGFHPHLESVGEHHELVLDKCPFAPVAARSPDSVCQLHLGLAEGVCRKAGGAAVEGLCVADPYTGGCRLTLWTETEPPPIT